MPTEVRVRQAKEATGPVIVSDTAKCSATQPVVRILPQLHKLDIDTEIALVCFGQKHSLRDHHAMPGQADRWGSSIRPSERSDNWRNG